MAALILFSLLLRSFFSYLPLRSASLSSSPSHCSSSPFPYSKKYIFLLVYALSVNLLSSQVQVLLNKEIFVPYRKRRAKKRTLLYVETTGWLYSLKKLNNRKNADKNCRRSELETRIEIIFKNAYKKSAFSSAHKISEHQICIL